MIEEDQTQAEARQPQESPGEQDQAQPGFFTAAEAFPAVDVRGLPREKKRGFLTGRWGTRRESGSAAFGHVFSFGRCLQATPASPGRRFLSRASSSSPVFQMSPAPRVRTRSPSLEVI